MHRRKPLHWASLCVLLAVGIGIPARGAAQHSSNAFASSKSWYVNPDYTRFVNSVASGYFYPVSTAMESVGRQPTAVWLDSIQAVDTMRTHLDRALAAGNDLILFVVYDLPGRDCAALASNGELPATAEGLRRYKREYVDRIAEIAHDARYAGIRIVFIIEPDSLPNMVSNVNDENPKCQEVAALNLYVKGVQYAVNKLVSRTRSSRYDNAYIYLDIAHSGWMGWSVKSLAGVLDGTARGFTLGQGAVDGFVSNVSNYTPLEEPFMEQDMKPLLPAITTRVRNASFYDGNAMIDELSYVKAVWSWLTASVTPEGEPREPWPTGIGMLVDTSRNGWGPRAAGPSEGATDINEFVRWNKVDKRENRALWCNQYGAGLGERPQATKRDSPPQILEAHVDALLWVKPPGQSDGSSEMGSESSGKNPDPSCDPMNELTIGKWTGNSNAMWDAPIAGEWFPQQFDMLFWNAYPPLL